MAGKPAGPSNKVAGGTLALAIGATGFVGAIAVVGKPGMTVVSTVNDVSRGTDECAAPAALCSLKSDRNFSSRVFMSSIPGALG